MALSDSLLPEFDAEMANTRKALERLPTEKFDYKPHPKSGTMGWLADHIATIPQWISGTLNTDSLVLDDWKPAPPATTTEQLLETFDKAVKEAREGLKTASDEALMQVWSMSYGGKEILKMPRAAVVRSMIMNHLIHHRGQLTVYMRLNDIPVPALYGPSADES